MLSRDAARRWQQRERGMCSDPDCDEPIEGWCHTCDERGPFLAPKLCARHLAEHTHAAGHEAAHPYGNGGAA